MIIRHKDLGSVWKAYDKTWDWLGRVRPMLTIVIMNGVENGLQQWI